MIPPSKFNNTSSFLLLITITVTRVLLNFSIITTTNAGTLINIRNNCPYTIWPASFPAGGGRRLESGQSWTVNFPLGTSGGLIWARTGCTFDGSGRGRCETGDCNGLLECRGHGSPPATLAEIATSLSVQNLDFFDVSLLKGFNLPVEFSPISRNCTRGPRCAPDGDILGRCPGPLRTSGGCNDACTVFKTDEYCCTGEACGPTEYSRFFKRECSDAYSYPIDGEGTAFVCPAGTDYKVVFCP